MNEAALYIESKKICRSNVTHPWLRNKSKTESCKYTRYTAGTFCARERSPVTGRNEKLNQLVQEHSQRNLPAQCHCHCWASDHSSSSPPGHAGSTSGEARPGSRRSPQPPYPESGRRRRSLPPLEVVCRRFLRPRRSVQT